jgi:ATP-dependent RNA helicase DeaD
MHGCAIKENMEITENVSNVQGENLFKAWNLSEQVLKSLNELKFTNPTPIQTQAIPLLLERKKDFVGLAATGTGKTGAFGIPLVESISADSKSVQALVMCPTRELASQVESQLQKMSKWKGLTTLTVFGGSSYDRQITALKRGVHIVVGTPGRLCDLIDRGVLKLKDVQTLVLDEADEMISMGFQDDLEKILEAIGEDETKRKWLFSATMSPEIRRVVSRYLPDYDKVEIHKEDSQKPQIEQIYYTIYPDRKLQMLSAVLYMNPEFYGLIFCQTKREVTEITDWLKRKSFKVDCIHGDRPQRERDFILKDFRSGRVKILVATDVAARGLDINDLTHVINFSLPREVESYVHRIGRTGRAGKKGLALSIVAPHEVKLLKRIQQVTKANLTKGKAPTNDELNVYRVQDVIAGMNEVRHDDVYRRAGQFLDRNMDQLRELFQFEFTVEEFLKRLLVSEHPDIFENRDTSMDFVGEGLVPREMMDNASRKRSFESRGDRSDRYERGDRQERYDRGGRSDRNDRGGRSDRNDRGNRQERNDRGDYSSRKPQGRAERFNSNEDSNEKTDFKNKSSFGFKGFKPWNADESSDSRPRQRSSERFTKSRPNKTEKTSSKRDW